MTPRDRIPIVPAAVEALLVEPATVAVSPTADAGAPIPAGQRNTVLTSWAGSLRRRGASCDEILAFLRVLNRRCSPPLSETDLSTIAKSVCRYSPDGSAIVQPGELAQAVFDPGPFPERLLHVPGLITDVMTYNLATAPRPKPVLALAGAIALQAVLAARRVRDARDNRTNLYVAAIAESGEGKDWSRKVNRKILYRAGLNDLLGPEDLASDAGLIAAVEQQPACLFQLDEFGRLLRTLTNPLSAPHLHNIVTALMRFYSCADTVFSAKAYADRSKNRAIDQPCVSLYGSATPGTFLNSLTSESLTDGFLARLLVFESPDHTPRQRVTVTDPPAAIIEQVKWWGDYRPGGNLRSEHPEPQLIQATPEADGVFDALADRTEQELGSPIGRALWARCEERACRLALVYACSANRLSPVIDQAAAEWATQLSVYQTQRLLALADRWIAENRQESNLKRVLRSIAAAGPGGITKSDLTRSTRWLTRRDRDEILLALVEGGDIGLSERATAGRPQQCYIAAGLAA